MGRKREAAKKFGEELDKMRNVTSKTNVKEKKINTSKSFESNTDKKSTNRIQAEARLMNAITKQKRVKIDEDLVKVAKGKLAVKEREVGLKEQRYKSEQALRVQERIEAYKQKRKEHIVGEFSNALESWKFKF